MLPKAICGELQIPRHPLLRLVFKIKTCSFTLITSQSVPYPGVEPSHISRDGHLHIVQSSGIMCCSITDVAVDRYHCLTVSLILDQFG